MLNYELKLDSKSFHFKKWICPFSSFSFSLITYFLRGTPEFKSIIHTKPCSYTYWYLFFFPFLIAGILTYVQSLIILKTYNRRVKIGYVFSQSDIHWNKRVLILLPFLAFLMGVLATGLGIGGGLVIGPILVEILKHPLISTASSNALVVFTSSSSTIQFAIMGKLNLKYSVYCLIIAILGSIFGSFSINFIVRFTGRASYIVFMLAFVCLFSSILVPLNSILKFVDRVNKGFSLWIFDDVCK